MKTKFLAIILGIVSVGVIFALVVFMLQSEQSGTSLIMKPGPFRQDESITFSFAVNHARDSCSIPSYEIFFEDDPNPVFYKSYMTPVCSEYSSFIKPPKTWDFPLEGDTISFDKNGIYTLVVKYHDEEISNQFTVTNYPNLLEETTFEIPVDFDFIYSFGVEGKNSYDSKHARYVADMVCDPSIIMDVNLSKEEKQKIWKSIGENSFFEMTSFTKTCDASGSCLSVSPEQKITLSVFSDGQQHTVQYRDSYIEKSNPSLAQFNNVIKIIQEILETKEEIKNLPEPRCGYM